ELLDEEPHEREPELVVAARVLRVEPHRDDVAEAHRREPGLAARHRRVRVDAGAGVRPPVGRLSGLDPASELGGEAGAIALGVSEAMPTSSRIDAAASRSLSTRSAPRCWTGIARAS